MSRADRRDRALFAGWVCFALVNQLSVLVIPWFEAVAFHFVWISLAIVYGIQAWSTRRIAVVLAFVTVLTGAGMYEFVRAEDADWLELTEVPLMGLVFLSMVWHVRRRTEALAETRDLVERERRAQQVMELFVRNCSHEMRTPITVARGYTEMVRACAPDEQSRDDLDVVVDELDKLGGLAGRLLVLADAYESEEFEWAPLDLAALVQRTAARWGPAAERAWAVDAPPVVVAGDESRLEAALDALVENAVKFTNPGDRIILRCRPVRGGAEVEVEDDGIGFDRSRRDDGIPLPSSGRPGTGLGLAIVQAIAEGHGGSLRIEERRRSGALVRLTLPVLRPGPVLERPSDLENV